MIRHAPSPRATEGKRPIAACRHIGFMKIGRVGSTIHENITNFRGAARAIMQIFAARMHAYQRNLIQ